MSWTERTELLVGARGMEKLSKARITVVGCGGVGAYAAEMLVRAGVSHIRIIDNDAISESNLNRQLIALHSTLGKSKVRVLGARLKDINPDADIDMREDYLTEENVHTFIEGSDFVVDAIDTLSPKIALIQDCLKNEIPLVSSMGSGAKSDATKVRITDISGTYQCPLAHMLRKRLHKLGIRSGFQAVFSEELPDRNSVTIEESRNKKSQVGSLSYLPAVFGCVCAQAAIRRIVGIE